ncbi:MAG TPA: SRPBCC family protein [Bacteroidales bacterium]|nr:SRPBCC family protein [Bacteroidales bacterium]
MTEYSSEVQQIPYSAERIYTKLSDLNNLESVKSLLEGKVRDFTFDTDSCQFKVDPVGTVGIRIAEREPFKTIKMESVKSPIEFLGWIQLQEVAPNDTRLKLTFRADIPIFLKAMISSKLETGINSVAEMLSKIPY